MTDTKTLRIQCSTCPRPLQVFISLAACFSLEHITTIAETTSTLVSICGWQQPWCVGMLAVTLQRCHKTHSEHYIRHKLSPQPYIHTCVFWGDVVSHTEHDYEQLSEMFPACPCVETVAPRGATRFGKVSFHAGAEYVRFSAVRALLCTRFCMTYSSFLYDRFPDHQRWQKYSNSALK